jgi:hypothetical protein
MNRLLEIGFEPAGHWLLKGSELAFELSRHASQRNILYAFVSDGEVKYVGKTVQSLYGRMGGYKNPAPTQTTNVRNNARIKPLLLAGAAVDILALPDNGLLHYGQFHVNLAAGLEDSLISEISPQWNGSTVMPDAPSSEDRGARLQPMAPPAESRPQIDLGTHEPTPAPETLQLPNSIATFVLVVHKTYYNQGFFNVGVSHAAHFGGDGQEIEILCGNGDQPLIGTINRTANNNETPRIMGGKGLRDWFQRNVREMQEVNISVISQNAIRIQPRQG